MDIQNKEQWEKAFIKSCQEGLLEDLKHLCQKKYLDLGWADINKTFKMKFKKGNGLSEAAQNGHMDILKFLLTSSELKEAGHSFANLKKEDEGALLNACAMGHLEVVKYLLTSPELIEAGHAFADLHVFSDLGFRMACAKGHFEIVKYLLTSPELKEAGHTFANLHVYGEEGLLGACAKGHLKVVKYLLTSPELIEAGHTFADLHTDDERVLKEICISQQWKIMDWLVMDYGMKKTKGIEEIMKTVPRLNDAYRAKQEMGMLQDQLRDENEREVIVKNDVYDKETTISKDAWRSKKENPNKTSEVQGKKGLKSLRL